MLNEHDGRNRAKERGHEEDTLWNKTVAASGLSLLGLVLFGLLVLYIGVRTFGSGRTIDRPGSQWQRIQVGAGVSPDQTLSRYVIENAERDWLQSYGWQDENAKIARIPIDRAIDLMVDRHATRNNDGVGKKPTQDNGNDERTSP